MRAPFIGAALLLALIGSAPAHAQQCGKQQMETFTQVQFNECQAAILEDADGELNRLYKTQMSALKDAQKRDALKDAQRKWIAYRDAACFFEVGDGKGWDNLSIWPMRRDGCLTELTRQRTEQLKALVQCGDDCLL